MRKRLPSIPTTRGAYRQSGLIRLRAELQPSTRSDTVVTTTMKKQACIISRADIMTHRLVGLSMRMKRQFLATHRIPQVFLLTNSVTV